jgi:hypothetical protein
MLRPALLAAVLLAVLAAPARAATCPRQDAVRVPGAEQQVADCLDDLTTKGTATNGHTDASDWAGLNSQASRNPDEAGTRSASPARRSATPTTTTRGGRRRSTTRSGGCR